MIKGYNKNGLFVDTGFLRDHVSKLRQEKKIASELYENVKNMKNLSDPTVAYQYDSILRDIQQLIDYFAKMADSLAHIEDEAIQLSQEINQLIEDGTDETNRRVSQELML